MKTAFFAYLRPSAEEFEKLWSDCLFTFDTNILLHLYRYQDDTRDMFMGIFRNEKFINRLFLTHRVGFEFVRRRPEVISEQETSYSKLLSIVDRDVMQPLSNNKRHPHLSVGLLSDLSHVVHRIKAEMTEKAKEIKTKHSNDSVLEQLVELFDNRISTKFSDEEMSDLCAEGEKRYNDLVPPGYKDNVKKGNDKYGDLIIWKQIISHAKSFDPPKDVIIVTDDTKEDWWLIHDGMKNPHPVLIEEFYKETGQRIYFYTADMFLKHASELINTAVSQDVIDEVVEIREGTYSTREALLTSYLEGRHNYKVITESELMKQLKIFKEIVAKTGGYIGLKKFITEFLANKDFEINHAYAIINSLVEQKLIVLSTIFDEALGYNVKIVEIIESLPKEQPS